MKFNHWVALVGVALLGCAHGPRNPGAAPPGLEDAVQAFGLAFRSGDVNRVSALIAKHYVHINGSAPPIGRDAWLTWYAGFARSIRDDEHRFDRYELVDRQIVYHGEAAVVTGVVETAGTGGDGPFRQQIRVSNTWVFEGGRWRRAAFHDTVVVAKTK
ncbi:MAG: nuclear transport factor 2 family protein [Myxococcota bacterium]